MMNEIAMASMEMSAARISAGYAISMEKRMMDDMEQQAMGELEMLSSIPAKGGFIDTYA